MVNSYRYKTSSPGKYKKWTPEFSYEERYKKKRNREDQYISQFNPQERPILVIKKKHEYKGLKNPKVFNEASNLESYYKVSENTQLVDDLQNEIRMMENFIRRHTYIHKPKTLSKEDEGLSTVYKIEGQEFLPEGFIELDPLLLKDEYEFESKQDQELFDLEQRRMKELRRKQYEQRHNKKLRDVTIYVMDEKKNNVVEFLERWYEKHNRKINQAEIEYVAKVLDVDPGRLEYFQELYLKMKNIQKHQNQGTLKNFTQGLDTTDQFENVTPKYKQEHEPYVPTFLNKYEKKSQKLPRFNIKKKQSPSPVLNTKELDKTLVKTLGNTKEINEEENQEKDKVKEQKPNLKLQESQKKFEQNLESYFDKEIHTILDKIKGQKKQEDAPLENKDLINQYKQRITKDDENLREMATTQVNKDQSFEIPTEKEVRLSRVSQNKQKPNRQSVIENQPSLPQRFSLIGMSDNKQVVFHKLKPLLIDNEYFYQTVEGEKLLDKNKEQHILYTKNDQGFVVSEYKIPSNKTGESYSNEILDRPESFIGDRGKLVVVKNDKEEEVHSQTLRPTKPQMIGEDFEEQMEQGNFKKPTIHEVENIKTFQIPPVEFNGKEYKVVVEEISFPEQNFEQINVVVYNEQNNIISNKSVDPSVKGNFYYCQIVEDENGQFFLVTKNNHGDTLNELELGSLEEELENKVIEQDETKLIKLNPIAIGDRFVRQEIIITPEGAKVSTYNDLDELMEESPIDEEKVTDQCKSVFNHDKEQIIIKTLNENGDELHSFDVPLDYAKYQDKNFDDIVNIQDEKGETKANIAVKSRGTQIFRSYSIRPTLIGDKFYTQTINEVLDAENPSQNQAILITQDEEGNVIDSRQIPIDKISDNYYNQILDQVVDNLGNKTSQLCIFNDNNELVGETTVNTALNPILGDEPFTQIIEQVVAEDEEGKPVTEILALQRNDEGTFNIHQEEGEAPVHDREYFEKIFDNMEKGERKRSFDGPQRDKSKTHHGMPENYKFIQAEKLANDNHLDEEVRDQINQALEDVHLITKMDDEQIEVIKESLKQVPEDDRRPSQTHRKHSHSRNSSMSHSDNCLQEHGSYLKQFEKSLEDREDSQPIRKSTIKDENRQSKIEENPKKKSVVQNDEEQKKKSTKNFEREKVEDFIRKNSVKEEPKKNKSVQKKKLTKKNQEKPKFKTYSQMHKEKLTSPSLIEEIYGNVEQINKEEPENQIDDKNVFSSWKENEKEIEEEPKHDSEEEQQQNQKNENEQSEEEIDNKNQLQEEVKEQPISKKSTNKMSNFQSFDQNKDEVSDNTSFKSFERHESDLKNQLKEVVNEEEKKVGPDVFKKMQEKTGMTKEEMMDDFYKFCKGLQKNTKYKESVLFATLFFYYLEKKKKKTHQ